MHRGEANLTQTMDDEPALLMAMGEEIADGVIMFSEGPNSNTKEIADNMWYLDKGASNYMTGCRDKFESLDKSIRGQVKFGDGSLVKIEGKGTINMVCKNGETRTLHGVYYIPTLRSKIISLGQLSEEGNRVVLNGESLWVYDSCGRLLMHVKRSANRLYKIHIESSKEVCPLTKAEEEAWLWHSRLGHVNFKAMQLMAQNKMAHDFPSICLSKELCSGCFLSKQQCKSFSHSNFVAKHVLELIHGDLCGPISPPTPAGNKYFMLLVDDYSRMMWVYMLKNKDEALDCFKKFKLLVENGKKKTVQVFRTDRGGEFCSKDFEKFCADSGILRHYTSPYTPQQNGVVERRNRTVAAMTRSLLKERNVPVKFWREAVKHAVHILNKLPTRALSNVTPHEVWFERKPSVADLKVFGCISYMKVPSVLTRKLDDRSQLLVHFGRETGTKAYRLYDPTSDRIHISRDVVFDEAKGWDWAVKNHASEVPLQQTTLDIPEFDDESSLGSERDTPVTPLPSISSPQSVTPSSASSSATSESEPQRFRSLADIYDTTAVVELEEELLLSGIDELVTFEKAIKDEAWRVAMDTEIDTIERNQT